MLLWGGTISLNILKIIHLNPPIHTLHHANVVTPPPHNRGGGEGGEAFFLVLWFPRVLESDCAVEDKLLRSRVLINSIVTDALEL